MDQLQRHQLDVTARLAALERFSTVQVVCSRPRSEEDATLIQSKIDNALAGLVRYLVRDPALSDAEHEAAVDASGRAGLCIMVLMPEVELPNVNGPGPGLVKLVLTVRVVENPLVNMNATSGTQITAEDAALHILKALHGWSPNGANAFYGDAKPIRPLEGAGKVMYDVIVQMQHGLSIEPAVQPPVIAEATSLITLTCATAGASLYYTTDGTLPTPYNATATLYSAPFDVSALPSGTVVRAAAHKSGLLPSPARQITL